MMGAVGLLEIRGRYSGQSSVFVPSKQLCVCGWTGKKPRGNNGDVAGRNTGVLVVVLSRRRQGGVSYILKCVQHRVQVRENCERLFVCLKMQSSWPVREQGVRSEKKRGLNGLGYELFDWVVMLLQYKLQYVIDAGITLLESGGMKSVGVWGVVFVQLQ